MSRGNRQEAIFKDDVDRQDLFKNLAETCQKTGFEVHAYCLMGNHYHLLIETSVENLVVGMKWLQGTFTQRLEMGHETRATLAVREIAASRAGWLAKLRRRIEALRPSEHP